MSNVTGLEALVNIGEQLPYKPRGNRKKTSRARKTPYLRKGESANGRAVKTVWILIVNGKIREPEFERLDLAQEFLRKSTVRGIYLKQVRKLI